MTRLAAETPSATVRGKNVLMMPDMIHGGEATERSTLESTILLRTVTVEVIKGKRYLLDGEFGAAVKSFEVLSLLEIEVSALLASDCHSSRARRFQTASQPGSRECRIAMYPTSL
jgi:hypothetical protein